MSGIAISDIAQKNTSLSNGFKALAPKAAFSNRGRLFRITCAMSPIASLRTRLRSLLGERIPRSLPRRSRKPRIGTYVVHVEEGLRLVMQAGLSDEQWQWLMDRGWRVPVYHPDRRAYRDIPVSFVTRLIDSDYSHREQVMFEAVMSAQEKPSAVRRHS
jgi:hypothetical protein